MNRITDAKRRPGRSRTYRSPLRDGQTETTRTRILDALIRTMAHGVVGVSVPAVAKEAEVSIPTVYRHFKTKAELVAALGPHLFERTQLMTPPASSGSGDLGAVTAEMYARAGALSADLRAAMASDLGSDARRRMMPERLTRVRTDVQAILPSLTEADLDRLTRFTLIAVSSAAIRAYEEYLGLSPAAASEDVAFIFRAIQRGLTERPGTGPRAGRTARATKRAR